MAERRMFSKSIIDSDLFLDMPAISQLLYFHLAMRADDDGFVDKPKSVMKLINCKDADLQILIDKKYVIPFESGIVVISHWKKHNYIQRDRYRETSYKAEKNMLAVQDSVYTLDTECIQVVSKMDTQVRLGKVRLEKGKNINIAQKQKTPIKNKYADEVFLSEEEYNKLCSEYSKAFADKCISVLNNYKMSNGKKYKSDYYAIRNWVIDRVKKDNPSLAPMPADRVSAEDLFKNPFIEDQ